MNFLIDIARNGLGTFFAHSALFNTHIYGKDAMDMSSTNSALMQESMITKMGNLKRHREPLHQLQSVWDNLTLLGQLSGTGTDMNETRQAFSHVTSDVMDSLAEETLKRTITAISAKAQVTVDIVIRNLFERTADIGFLATDDDIRAFLFKHADGLAGDADAKALRMRFEEYVKKYSVYSNIILLDPQGNVLLQLDQGNPVTASQDPLIQESLFTNDAYVEVFRQTDLLPGQDVGLIYAYRITSGQDSTPLGVLCLCFRFENEMEGVFSDLITPQEWAVGLLLGADGRVIASSDHYQIPIGVELETTENEDWLLTRFAGREYLAVTKKTKGYQGYMGPGWMGHAMIPLDYAFDDDISAIVNRIDPKLLHKVMHSPLLFSQTLLGIPKQAAQIQSKLNQSVWNGNIRQKQEAGQPSQQTSFSKMLLWEVSNNGFKTQRVIEETVSNLYQTVVSVMLENSRFYASLAVDIMDRNLYERANDCRWWALTSSFKSILSKPQITAEGRASIAQVLGYINSLYTVYDNLLVFDGQGQIVAVSNPEYQHCVGTTLDAEWAIRTRTLHSSQQYVVSRFEPSPLYKNQPTYIYAAAIRSKDNGQTAGGIGIVFDSTPQFSAMLADSLPKDAHGEPLAGSFTLYVDAELQVISSTSAAFPVGSQFDVKPSLCRLAAGDAAFDIAIYEGRYYAVGARASSGYREYKGPIDAYQNHITALIFIPLGNASDIDAILDMENTMQHNQLKTVSTTVPAEGAEEYATFYVDNQWFGLPASEVLEAVQATSIKPLPDSSPAFEGLMQYKGGIIPIVNMAKLLGVKYEIPAGSRQVVVIQPSEKANRMGLLVSALGEIPAIVPDQIEPIASIFPGSNIPVEGVIKVDTQNVAQNMLIILSADHVWSRIKSSACLQAQVAKAA